MGDSYYWSKLCIFIGRDGTEKQQTTEPYHPQEGGEYKCVPLLLLWRQ